MRAATGSQWSSMSSGVTCALFGWLNTRRAAAFWITCSGFTGHTHTNTRAHAGLRALLYVRSAFHPSRTVLPPGPPRSSGQLLSARGPSETSVSVTDGQKSVLFLHVFSVGVLIGGNPL